MQLATASSGAYSSLCRSLPSFLSADLCRQWWFQHDSLEPTVAVLAFVLPLTFFYNLDLHVPAALVWRLNASNDVSQWLRQKPDSESAAATAVSVWFTTGEAFRSSPRTTLIAVTVKHRVTGDII